MKEPLKMYQAKAIIRHDEPVELPRCMYQMKNILSGQKSQSFGGHVSSSANKNLDLSEQVNKILKKFQTTHPEMATLLARQEHILKQLEDLKEQMISLKGSLNLTQTTNTDNLSCKNTIQSSAGLISDEMKNASDIVINVSTSNPPYSLLILQKLWAQSVHIIIRTYFHSTVVNIPNKVNDFIALIDNCEANVTIPQFLIRLIWKEVDENMELITSSSINMPIHGETNIIRYFSRIGPSNFNYELLTNAAEIDSILDVSYLLSRSRTKTERQQLIQSLNGSLAKNQWLCNSKEISIADIVASSVIQQVTNPSDINVNVTKWMQRCQQTYAKAR